MRTSRSNILTPSACFILGLMLLVLPLQWILAAVFAAAFHELCHWAAVYLCGGRMLEFHAGAAGAVMETGDLTLGQELFCALAGPLGALFLLLVAGIFPRIAVCAVFQSAYNLLPLYPLDGGRAVRCATQMLFHGEGADKVCTAIETGCMMLCVCVGVYGTVWLKLGNMPLLMAGAICFRGISGKRPCKPWRKRVQ